MWPGCLKFNIFSMCLFSFRWSYGVLLWEIVTLGKGGIFKVNKYCFVGQVVTAKNDHCFWWKLLFISGANPYPGLSGDDVIDQLRVGYRMPKPPFCSDELWVSQLALEALPTVIPRDGPLSSTVIFLVPTTSPFIQMSLLKLKTALFLSTIDSKFCPKVAVKFILFNH